MVECFFVITDGCETHGHVVCLLRNECFALSLLRTKYENHYRGSCICKSFLMVTSQEKLACCTVSSVPDLHPETFLQG